MGSQEQREFITDLVKLKVWYVRWLQHMGVAFEDAAQRHTDLCRHTVIFHDHPKTPPAARWADPRWRTLLAGLKGVYDRYPGHPARTSTIQMETEAFQLLAPSIEAALVQPPEPSSDPAPYTCFSYRVREEGLALHFRNTMRPESPFGHTDELIESLRTLLAHARRAAPTARLVFMHSWLNSFAPFLALFPPSWEQSACPLGPDSGDGAWGQFVDRRGHFHARHANVLRKTGRLPYAYRRCSCGADELSAFLHARHAR